MTDSRAAGWWSVVLPGWIPGTLLTLPLACCGATPGSAPSDNKAPATATLQWSYQGETGPEHWGSLDPSFASCARGQSQSPVDLAGAVEQDLTEVVFNYSPTKIHLSHDGRALSADCPPGDSIRFDKGTFELARFQVHRPSEHSIDGRTYPLEIQFLHRDDSGRLVMVAVLCREGAPNPALDTFADGLPSRDGEQGYLGKAVPLQDLLPARRTAYRYDGSLTTPPCTEPVFWIVLEEPLEVSADQLAAFERAIAPNQRPRQPLNGRVILLGD